MNDSLLLIFDLDGTLIDSRLDLANAVNATRVFMQRPPLENELIYRYVGNGALVLIQRAMGSDASAEEIDRAHGYFLAYYRDHALEHTTLYAGAAESLQELKDAGHRLAVLTNKPVRISNTILRGLGVEDLFFAVHGGDSFEFKKPNPIGIDSLRAATGVSAVNTWMVGDSSVDILTARNAGVFACGLTYGFQPDTLQQAPPDVLAPDLGAFVAHLRAQSS